MSETVNGVRKFDKKAALLLGLLTVLATVYYFILLFAYVSAPGYFDHAEPSLAFSAWRLTLGTLLYLPYGSQHMIVNNYGPVSYLLHSVAFLIFGGSIGADVRQCYVYYNS